MASIGFAASLLYYLESSTVIAIYSTVLMMMTALVWLNEFCFPKHIEKLQAIGYGLVLALITIKGTNVFMYSNSWQIQVSDSQQSAWFQPWMGELLLSVVTLFVVWKLLQKNHPKPSQLAILFALGGALVLSILSMQTQGLMVGMMIMLLGFSASNRVLQGLGIIALLFFISSYYYLLESTLLDKSIALLIIGTALIVGRSLILKFLPDANTEGSLR
jgi:uncharacterized membrane protein